MTESEWQTCEDPRRMLEWLRAGSQASDRKFRLFAVAYSRWVWERLTSRLVRHLVELTERFADGEAPAEELARLREASRPVGLEEQCACDAAYHEDIQAVITASAEWYYENVPAAERTWAGVVQCEVIRDLFNPFRPVLLHPSWQSPPVLALARAIYERRAFERLPELATALVVAGCTDAELLGHLRGPGPHQKGCWAVDLLLGKK
jgi:hypothetical protein